MTEFGFCSSELEVKFQIETFRSSSYFSLLVTTCQCDFAIKRGMPCPSWQWHRTGYGRSPVRIQPVAAGRCGVTWDSSRTVVVIKLQRTSAFQCDLAIKGGRGSAFKRDFFPGRVSRRKRTRCQQSTSLSSSWLHGRAACKINGAGSAGGGRGSVCNS